MSFDAAFQRTVGLEGKYSNTPGDSGGPTMYGITQAVARAHGYQGPMQNMPLDTAKSIYQASYWDLIHLGDIDALSPTIAAELFDTGVNCGVSVPMPFLQRALNALNRQGKDYADIPVDGLGGARTVQALKAYLLKRSGVGIAVLIKALNCQQGYRYFNLAEAKPSQEDFLFGWLQART